MAVLELLVRQAVALTEKLGEKQGQEEGGGGEEEAMRVAQASLLKQVREGLPCSSAPLHPFFRRRPALIKKHVLPFHAPPTPLSLPRRHPNADPHQHQYPHRIFLLLRDKTQKQAAELLGRVTSVVTTEPRVWLAYATFNEGAYPDGSRRVRG